MDCIALVYKEHLWDKIVSFLCKKEASHSSPLQCWTPQMACVPVTISRTSPSHSSTHHSLWCTSCTWWTRELSTWQESYLLWVCSSSSLHPCQGTCQSQQAANAKGQHIYLHFLGSAACNDFIGAVCIADCFMLYMFPYDFYTNVVCYNTSQEVTAMYGIFL